MRELLFILIICSLAAASVSIIKGLLPMLRFRKELSAQKQEFKDFLEAIRHLSGQKHPGETLRKIASPEDTMYRVLQKHTFFYGGGLGEFDEKLKALGRVFPCEIAAYCDGACLYLMDRVQFGKGREEGASESRNIRESSVCLELDCIQKKEVLQGRHPALRLVYAGSGKTEAFLLDSYEWIETFLQEQVAVEVSDVNEFFDITSGRREGNRNSIREANLAEYKGFFETLAEKLFHTGPAA